MKYQEARSHFKNGDIVFFSGGKRNWVRRLITWFSKGPMYHVGIALWMKTACSDSPKLMIAESQPDGYRIINMGFYADRNMTVFRSPVAWERMVDNVMDSTGVVPYDFYDLAAIGMHERFNLPLPKRTGDGEVCSVMVAKLLHRSGYCGTDIMVSPQRLSEQLAMKLPIAFVVDEK